MARTDIERPEMVRRSAMIHTELWEKMRQAAVAMDVGEDMPSISALLRRYIAEGLERDGYEVSEEVQAAIEREKGEVRA